LVALVLISWIIVRQGRTNLVCANLQRLVALEHQTFIDELNAISDDAASIAVTAVSAKKSVTSIGNAVIGAIRKIETRLDTLQDRIEESSIRDDERGRQVDASEVRRLRFTIDRISKSQRLLEERLSDDIRFNLERAKIADASLRGLVNRMEAFSERLNGFLHDYDDLSAAVGLLKGRELAPPALEPRAGPVDTSSEREMAPAKSDLNPGGPSAEDLINQPNIGPNVAEPTQASVGYTSDEAA
jgi:hypothetical protein